jgi:Zn-dependent protease with chaperone function
MSSGLMVAIVLLASFGLVALLLCGLVAVAWHVGLKRIKASSADVLALRLLPVAGALLVAVTVVLPAFLRYEPRQDHEAAGPLLLILAAFALLTVAHGIWRGWRAWTTARAILHFSRTNRCLVENGQIVHVVDVAEPIIGVVGGWRPRVITTECVITACGRDEFQQVLAHEAAHVSARDNLKLLLVVACPDALAWTRVGAAISDRWRTAAEFAADQHAAGNDPSKRLALAAALIKVARLFGTRQEPRHALTMQVGLDDVEGRVRQLLAPGYAPAARLARALASLAVLAPMVALPLYAPVHELIEAVVRFGL